MKTAYQKLTDKLDKLAGDTIKKRAGYKCERCGKEKERDGVQLQWAHIVRRGAKEVRKDLGNAFSLCAGCHWWFDNSANRGEADDFVRSKIREEKYQDLKVRTRITKRWLIHDLRLMETALQEIYDNL